MLYRVLNHLLQFTLHLVQASNVLPRDIWNFHHRLPQRRWVAYTKGCLEVVITNTHAVKYFCIDRIIFEIDHIHLLSDTLKCSFCAKRSQICSNKSMCIFGNSLQVNIGIKLHVLCVNAQYFQATYFIWYTDIDLTIKPTETPKRSINTIWTVGSSHNNHMAPRLEAIHQCEKLRNNAPFNLTLGLLAFRCNGIYLVNENDCRRILLGFLKRLPQVTFRFTCKLAHDLRAVDKEKECPCFISDRSRNEGLSTTWWAIQENSFGRFHTNGFKERRMPQGKLNQLPNLSHLLADTTHVIVANVIKLLLVLARNWLAFTEDFRVWCDNAVVCRISFNNLEFNRSHAPADKEGVSLSHRSVRFQEIGFQEHVEKVPAHAFDGIVEREDVNPFAILHVRALVHGHHVSQSHAKVLSDCFVHPDLRLFASVIDQHDADGVSPFLALQQDGVSSEQLQFFHRFVVERDDGVVVVHGIVHHQPVRTLLPFKDGGAEIFLFSLFVFGFHGWTGVWVRFVRHVAWMTCARSV
mmetsp:Transcript_8755/g.53813  ORF Transcript_8755/g.53813 Transcript_8755/m.53813 type:complete len:522 (-) Transcript_8755:65-1630(-)